MPCAATPAHGLAVTQSPMEAAFIFGLISILAQAEVSPTLPASSTMPLVWSPVVSASPQPNLVSSALGLLSGPRAPAPLRMRLPAGSAGPPRRNLTPLNSTPPVALASPSSKAGTQTLPSDSLDSNSGLYSWSHSTAHTLCLTVPQFPHVYGENLPHKDTLRIAKVILVQLLDPGSHTGDSG